MTTHQTFRSLGSIAFVMTKWIKLRAWAQRNGDTITAARATEWIDDCKARAQRLSFFAGAPKKNAEAAAVNLPTVNTPLQKEAV